MSAPPWPTSSTSAARRCSPRSRDAQIARIAEHAKRRPVAAGEILFEQGAANSGIYVVLSGALEIVGPGRRRRATSSPSTRRASSPARSARSPAGAASSAAACARRASVLVLDRDGLRQLVQGDPELSDAASCARSSCGAWRSWRTGFGDAVAHRLAPLGGHAAAAGVPHAQRPPVRLRRRRRATPTCRRCSIASTSASTTCRSSSAAASACSRTRRTKRSPTASA